MFILTSLFFYCSTAKADDCDSNVIELYDYETGQTSNISISDYSINFLPASGIILTLKVDRVAHLFIMHIQMSQHQANQSQ